MEELCDPNQKSLEEINKRTKFNLTDAYRAISFTRNHNFDLKPSKKEQRPPLEEFCSPAKQIKTTLDDVEVQQQLQHVEKSSLDSKALPFIDLNPRKRIHETSVISLEESTNKVKLRKTTSNNEKTEKLLDAKVQDVQKPSLKSHTSPKKRIEISSPSKSKPTQKQIFQYGNYSHYYGYRNLQTEFQDPRLELFSEQRDILFNGKTILDIGCNIGLLTNEIAKRFAVKHITGLDIDKNLINKATNFIKNIKKNFKDSEKTEFPFNVSFFHGNYVLKNDVLLEIERKSSKFDTILCLSLTKWIHLNFGDAALKQAFKRMYLQLHPGGNLILEAQSWDGYRKRKKLTKEICENYKNVQFFPKDFEAYLLGPEIGFEKCYTLGTPGHCSKGFQRPIQIFVKKQ